MRCFAKLSNTEHYALDDNPKLHLEELWSQKLKQLGIGRLAAPAH
jgi:hypothetical protein